MTHGEYLVSGTRAYAGHEPGVTFIARLNPHAEQRAIQRGDITLLQRVTPTLPPGYEFPPGWLPAEPSPNHRGAERAPLS